MYACGVTLKANIRHELSDDGQSEKEPELMSATHAPRMRKVIQNLLSKERTRCFKSCSLYPVLVESVELNYPLHTPINLCCSRRTLWHSGNECIRFRIGSP